MQSSRRSWTLALALAAAVGGGWWVQRRVSDPRTQTALAPKAEARVDSPPTVALVDSDEGDRRAVIIDALPAATNVSEFAKPAPETSNDARAPSGPEHGVCLVRVVDGEDRPVGGVIVDLTVTTPDFPVPHVLGTATTDDVTGIARFERVKVKASVPGIEVVARACLPIQPPAEAVMRSAPFEGELRIVIPTSARAWLEPHQVEVVTSAGRPAADVTVALFAVPSEEPGANRRGYGTYVTKADGIAEIPRAKSLLGLMREMTLGTHLDLFVEAQGGFANPPSSRIDVARAQGSRVRLVIPDTARVEVEVRNDDGSLAPDGATVILAWRTRDGSEKRRYEQSADSRKQTRNGVAVFDNVGIGLDLHLTAFTSDGSIFSVTVPANEAVTGPTRAGEIVRRTLHLGPRNPDLIGRIVERDGKPAAGFASWFGIGPKDAPLDPSNYGRLTARYTQSRCDGDGRFRIRFEASRLRSAALIAEFSEMPPNTGMTADWVGRFARVDLPTRVADGEVVDLGDLVLAELPLVVAGLVVDRSGRPVWSARMTIQYLSVDAEDRDWINFETQNLSVDKEGRFALRDLAVVRKLMVGAYRADIGSAEARPVAPGSTDVRIVLDRAEKPATGRVVGSVLLDEEVSSTRLFSECKHTSGEWGDSSQLIAGRFVFRSVPVGDVTIEIRTWDTQWTLARVEHVLVRDGVDTTDSRLSDLDLRSKLRLLRLRFLDSAGSAIARTGIAIRAHGRGGALSTDEHGQFAAWTLASDDEFTIDVNGYQPVKVRYSAAEQELVLTARDP